MPRRVSLLESHSETTNARIDILKPLTERSSPHARTSRNLSDYRPERHFHLETRPQLVAWPPSQVGEGESAPPTLAATRRPRRAAALYLRGPTTTMNCPLMGILPPRASAPDAGPDPGYVAFWISPDGRRWDNNLHLNSPFGLRSAAAVRTNTGSSGNQPNLPLGVERVCRQPESATD